MNIFKQLIVAILTWEARLILARHKPRVIAVSGSVGKTATKDAIFAVLSSRLHVRKSEKSMNSEFGVPLTILGLHSGWRNPFIWLFNIIKGLVNVVQKTYPKWLVLEIGADRPGDIRKIAKWVRPDIVVLTHVPEIPVHVEFFDSPQAVVDEKRSLVEYIRAGGTLIVNGDDLLLRSGLEKFSGNRITFGLEEYNNYFANDIMISYDDAGNPEGMKFRLNHSGTVTSVAVHGSLGLPRVYSALAAIATAEISGVPLESAIKALSLWEPPPGRMRILQGIKGSVIIDDTYNSSPAAVNAALDTLSDIQAKRKISVLGDMLELGKYSADSHRQIGARAAMCTDILWTVGIRSRVTGEAALDGGMKDKNVREYELEESMRAGKELESILKPGDVVLIKGSQSMRMERTVLEIMAEPQKAAELLVRQDPEWLAKE